MRDIVSAGSPPSTSIKTAAAMCCSNPGARDCRADVAHRQQLRAKVLRVHRRFRVAASRDRLQCQCHARERVQVPIGGRLPEPVEMVHERSARAADTQLAKRPPQRDV